MPGLRAVARQAVRAGHGQGQQVDMPDVAEAAIIGVPHERWGEVGRAIVVLAADSSSTAEDLIAPYLDLEVSARCAPRVIPSALAR